LHGSTDLMMVTTTTFCCCPSRIPTSAFGKRDVGATGRIPKRSHTHTHTYICIVFCYNAPGCIPYRECTHPDCN
jgi:hypothetical protein